MKDVMEQVGCKRVMDEENTALHMFEELGYERDENDESIEYNVGWDCVQFFKKLKTYSTLSLSYQTNIETHKAITQQMKELGWL